MTGRFPTDVRPGDLIDLSTKCAWVETGFPPIATYATGTVLPRTDKVPVGGELRHISRCSLRNRGEGPVTTIHSEPCHIYR